MDETNAPLSLSVDIGRKIVLLRERKDMTTTALAHRVGISQAQISRLENGKQGFRTQTLEKIAEALNVPVISFFEDVQTNGWSDQAKRAFKDPNFRSSVERAAAKFAQSPDAFEVRYPA